MDAQLKKEALRILEEGHDMTLATVREDGGPQATTVSYASDGMAIYFGCGAQSQKARNLAHESRVSLTVDLPYANWGEIRGLSISGKARRLTRPDEVAHAGELFMKKFSPEIAQYMTADTGDVALFEIRPDFVSVLDYRKGFGHTDLVTGAELAA